MAASSESAVFRAVAALLGAIAAAGLVVIIAAAAQRTGAAAGDVPEMIDDCFDRIDRIEAALHRIRPEDLATG